MLGSRRIRLVAAGFVGSAVVALLWPQATGYVSKFAVINAPVLTVRAPIDGTIVVATPGVASPLRRDDVLLDVRATRASRAELARLQADVSAKTRQAGALLDEEASAQAIRDMLEKRVSREVESEVTYLVHKISEEQAIRDMHAAQLGRATRFFQRARELSERGMRPEYEVEDARTAVLELEALIAASEARTYAMETELAAIRDGLPSPAGTGRRDFAHDRLDDIAMALADIKSRRMAAEGQRDAALAQLAELRDELDGLARFRPVASTDGVVWTASRQSGASVTNGSDLLQMLDCERRFIEVVFEERAFENLSAGTEATVRLRGSDTPFKARVVSRHAAGGGAAVSAVDAAVLTQDDSDGVKVFLAMEPADVSDPAVAEAFCDVGRTAEVQIRHPRFEGLLKPLSDTWARLTGQGGEAIASRRGR